MYIYIYIYIYIYNANWVIYTSNVLFYALLIECSRKSFWTPFIKGGLSG